MSIDREVKISASAVVRVTIEIDADGCWGGDCPVAQVDRQARRSAEGVLRKISEASNGRVRIVGEPEIVRVVTQVVPR